MRRFSTSLVYAAASLALSGAAFAQDYDLVIHNGRVLDGTGAAWFRADVAIKDGRVAALPKPNTAKAKREIDAKNQVVAPGFIDVHTHADEGLLSNPAAENFIRDGVTTLVTGNCGGSPRDVGKYLDACKSTGVAPNIATLIGHNTVLRAVKGDKAGDLSEEQMTKAKQIVDEAMRDGAVGFSTGLIYTPGKYSDTKEIIELAKVSAGYGGIYASHMRSEGGAILEAIDEALTVGREAGCRVEISHFKLPSDIAAKLGGAKVTLGKVLAAREAGQEVWLDQYPYTASSTSLSTLLPDWVAEGGADDAKKLLKDEAQLAKVLSDMKESNETKRGRKDMAYAYIAGCRAFPSYAGLNIKQVAQVRKQQAIQKQAGKSDELLSTKPADLPEVTMEDQYRAIIDIYLAGGAQCVFHSMAEPEVEDIMRSPLVSVASDSGVRDFGQGVPHPRGYGTNARVLGVYVRDRKVIPLEEAVRRMTSQPALAFRLADRGAIRAGGFADIVIFDPETVSDKATFDKPHQYSVGFSHVLVNGQPVIDDAKLTEARPGMPLRGPGYVGAEGKRN